MSLYPSLEDMQVDQLGKAQHEAFASQQNTGYPTLNSMPVPASSSSYQTSSATSPYSQNLETTYPSLKDYMGLELTEDVIAQNMPEYSQVALPQQNYVVPTAATSNLVAPVSGQSLGLYRAQVTHGIRELTLCKDKDNKVGLRVKSINNGIFVCLVIDKSPAALGGLRFGDQILQVNGTNVAGYSMEKVHDLIKKSPINGIKVAVRDRPFERTVTLHKDSTGSVGFQFKNGKITAIVKDSSSARNGVLTDHQLLEVEGQNVVGLKDKQISKIIEEAGNVITVTVIPSFMYEHMVKKMHGSLLRELMDHSIPDI